ncbi:MAG: MerR family transcriptional regulator [Rhodospirillales bacterium]
MYSIKTLCNMTGLNPHTLRVWERRYNVLSPHRGVGGRRAYDDADLIRIRLIARLVKAGLKISDLAPLANDDLEDLCNERLGRREVFPFDHILDLARRFDGREIDRLIGTALLSHPPLRAMEEVIAPLLRLAGEAWECGDLGTTGPRVISDIVRRHLTNTLAILTHGLAGQRVVFGTLSGEQHDVGALMAAIVAAGNGFDILYLGADLPVDDFILTVSNLSPQALALSLPQAREGTETDLERLLKALSSGQELWLGGAGAEAVRMPGDARLKTFLSLETFDNHTKALAKGVLRTR